MRFAGLSEIRAYWEALRRPDRPVPPRSAIDPRGIEGALAQAFLIARDPATGAGDPASNAQHPDRAAQATRTPAPPGPRVFRLAGQGVCDIAGRSDLRGVAPETLAAPADRAALARLLDEALDGPAVVEAALEARAAAGGARSAARLLLLPLIGEAGMVTQLLGGLALPAPPALQAPWLLHLRSARVTRLADFTDPGPAAGTTAPTLPAAGAAAAGYDHTQTHTPGGMAEAPEPFRPAARRRHLRLVK